MKVTTSERLQLRWLDANDAAFILRLVNEPSWLKYIGDRGIRTLDHAREYIETGPVDMYNGLGHGLYLVELLAGGDPIGICGFLKRDTVDDVELGFAFLPEFWGKGYALESAAAVMSYGRDTLGLTRIIAVTTPDNHSSIRLLNKLGFRFERTVRLDEDGDTLPLYAFE